MSKCRGFSCVVGRGCLLWPAGSLGKTLWAFSLFHSVLQGQICLLWQVFLDFLLLHSRPLIMKRTIFRGGCSWRSFIIELFNFTFFRITGLGIDLDCCDITWLTFEKNRDHSVVFEIASKYAFQTLLLTMRAAPTILRFLPTVVDIIII